MTQARLAGKTALVTGAGRGIGRATALELAREGANIVVNDLDDDAAERVAAEVRALGPQAIAQPADVGDRRQVDAMFAAARETFPTLDVLVANAVFSIRKPLLELTVEDVERTWAVSLWGVFHTCQEAARRMVEQGAGSITVISSVHSFRPYPNASAYNGAKAAVNQMAKTWAVELAPNGVRVNVIEPGWTNTPGERTFHSEEALSAGGAGTLLGRLAEPEEVARAAAFLASDDASYVIGSVLRVDGGFSLHH